jgi:HK97 family phage major capsid protein
MDKIDDLYSKRSVVVDSLNRIKTELEKGTYNDQLGIEFDSLMKEFDSYTKQIEAEKRLSGIDLERSNYTYYKEHMNDESRKPGTKVVIDGNEYRTYAKGEEITHAPTLIEPGAYFRAWLDTPRNEAEERALSEGTDTAGGTQPQVGFLVV